MKKELAKLGFCLTDSRANFLFVTHPAYDARELFEALREAGIYIRYWGGGRIEQYMRITIGTREEMEALLSFLKEYVMRR